MDHTFVLCAYKESPYIEACARSLKEQSVPSALVLATSTPSPYLEQICEKYGLTYCVREGESGIAPDWNYALSCASTSYVTIAHQDDLYEKDYTKLLLQKMKKHPECLIGFCNYYECKNETFVRGVNLKIKDLLLLPLRIFGGNRRFARRFALRFGNAICCPSVMYHTGRITAFLEKQGRGELFVPHFRSNLDWEIWEQLSREKGGFCYLSRPLMAHRIHEGSETTATIQDHQRKGEDYEMFQKFWPKTIAKVLCGWYQKSEEGNQV